jgi:oligoribonuclease (3'-5' exoribonuclease)
MPKPTLIALDTETGGFDARVNPILSIAIVIADESYNTLDGFEIKVAPPRGTVLEIPAPGYFLPKEDYTKRKLECYMDVWTKEKLPCAPPMSPIIGCIAASVNGYIGEDARNWDFSAIDKWHATASAAVDAENDIVRYLTQHFGAGHVVTVAHNASFDQRFVESYMPTLFNKLKDRWFCTLAEAKAFRKRTGIEGGNKLVELAKLAGHDYKGKAHQAFADGEATLAVLRYLKKQA